MDSLSILSSQVLNLMSRVKSHTAGRGQWGFAAHKKRRERQSLWSAFYECTAEQGTIENRKLSEGSISLLVMTVHREEYSSVSGAKMEKENLRR